MRVLKYAFNESIYFQKAYLKTSRTRLFVKFSECGLCRLEDQSMSIQSISIWYKQANFALVQQQN